MATKVDAGKAVNIVLIIVGSVVGIGAAIYLFGALKGWLKSIDEGAKQLANEGATDPTKLSYTSAQYGQFADALFTAMDGFQTDEDTIYNTMSKMNTYEDLQRLISVFGTRKISEGYLWQSNDYTLGQALVAELDTTELSKVNSILLSKGINFSF